MSIVKLPSSSRDIPFDREPEQCFTMPARCYLDGDILEGEKEAIFYRNWWYAGHQSQLAEPGFPSWDAADDPTTEAPPYFLGTFILRATDLIHTGIDLQLKLDNVTNSDRWDAGREVLYPQRGFQGLLWLTMAL